MPNTIFNPGLKRYCCRYIPLLVWILNLKHAFLCSDPSSGSHLCPRHIRLAILDSSFILKYRHSFIHLHVFHPYFITCCKFLLPVNVLRINNLNFLMTKILGSVTNCFSENHHTKIVWTGLGSNKLFN